MSESFVKTAKGFEVKRVLELNNGIIKRDDIEAWNADLNRWSYKASEMVVLKHVPNKTTSKNVAKKSNKSKKGKK
ncbi:MAG: hypothetical protein Q4C30_01140 [Bacteroidia bacterium]|nr:hypothetical protein [Bacteroidia bacterium]